MLGLRFGRVAEERGIVQRWMGMFTIRTSDGEPVGTEYETLRSAQLAAIYENRDHPELVIVDDQGRKVATVARASRASGG